MKSVLWLLVACTALAASAAGAADPNAAGGAEAARVEGLGEYFLGVECRPVHPAVRAQLGLQESVGIEVGTVLPGTPAEKAGLRQHDVLLRAGETKLTHPRELIAAIEAGKGAKLPLRLIRQGKEMTVEVEPVRRSEFAVPDAPPPMEGMQEWFGGMMPREGDGPMRFRIFGPGAIVPPGTAAPPLPKDMAVVITRRGEEPAKVVVEQGEKRYEATEKDLGSLPPEVRRHVESLLPRQGGLGRWTPPVGEPGGAWPKSLERQMQELQRRMEEMQRSLDRLQNRRVEPGRADRT